MERMDRARTVGGLMWAAGGWVFQLVCWFALDEAPKPLTMGLLTAVTALAVASGLGLVRGAELLQRTRVVLAWAVALLLAADLAGAVADRFGVLGAPGDPGVSWGSWSAFVTYTDRLVPGGRGLAAVTAVGATVLEAALAVLLVAGRQRRWVGKALAGLFVLYTVTMGLGIGASEVAAYGMPVLVGGALLLSAVPARTPRAAPRRDRRASSSTRPVQDREPVRPG